MSLMLLVLPALLRVGPPPAPPARRAVWQVLAPVAPIGAAPPPPFVLHPIPLAAPRPGPVPAECAVGGCRHPDGRPFSGPPGQLLNPEGKVCTRSAGHIYCP